MAQRSEHRGDLALFEPPPGSLKGWIVAHCDGGSRGNPGPSGFGVLIVDKAGKVLAELSEFLGKRTNNFAEYSALLAALNFAIDNGHPRLRVVADSELMVKQIKGQYRVNSPDLKPLHEEARHRIARLEGFEIQHVLREKNRKADDLANLAMDRGMGRRATDAAPIADAERAPAPKPVPEPVPVRRPGGAPATRQMAAPQPRGSLRGFVKGGVVHPLDGAKLPDGAFVTIIWND